MLFADVTGSMELAEQLDPEEWHAILEHSFEILTDDVPRVEGTVNRYTDAGIMALFGAPIAHEDHAQRACYAALHLRDRIGQYPDDLRIAPGVNFSSGEATAPPHPPRVSPASRHAAVRLADAPQRRERPPPS